MENNEFIESKIKVEEGFLKSPKQLKTIDFTNRTNSSQIEGYTLKKDNFDRC